ncbi:MAG: sigma-70 family RNA polymerase sigma factor [Actinobacteria bacterium]|nr:sigma-70 family RNA polymerase sigma factor [Actinomycetota bacterium]
MLALLVSLALERMEPEKERELVERARSSPQAFSELYEHYMPLIYRYLLRRTGNAEAAEDLTATTFEKALRHLETFQWKEVSFSAWLYRIATNNLVDYYRREGRRRETSLQDLEGVLRSPMGAGEEEMERVALLMDLVRRLPLSYQHILALKFYQGLDHDEMCEVLGVNKKTLSMKIYRSLRALRKAAAEAGLLEEGM